MELRVREREVVPLLLYLIALQAQLVVELRDVVALLLHRTSKVRLGVVDCLIRLMVIDLCRGGFVMQECATKAPVASSVLVDHEGLLLCNLIGPHQVRLRGDLVLICPQHC